MSLKEAREIRLRFGVIAAAALVTVVIGTVMMMRLEDLRFIDALYFSVIALTTVGFGDITPQTDGGKLFVMVYLVVGIAIIAAFVNNLLRYGAANRVIKNSDSEKH